MNSDKTLVIADRKTGRIADAPDGGIYYGGSLETLLDALDKFETSGQPNFAIMTFGEAAEIETPTKYAECFNELPGFMEGTYYKFEKVSGDWVHIKKVDGRWTRTTESFTESVFRSHFS